MEKSKQAHQLLARLCKTIGIKKPRAIAKNVIAQLENGSKDNLENLMLFEFGKFHVAQIKKEAINTIKKKSQLKETIGKVSELERKVKQLKKEYKVLNSLVNEK
jgi:GTP1/Obg family GTP-binding protein